MNIDRRLPRAVWLIAGWMVIWTGAWFWRAPPKPFSRIELPQTAALMSVSNTGLVSVAMDAGASSAMQQPFMAKVWDIHTGHERELPLRPGDQPFSWGLNYQYPYFVLRDGCVQQIDAVTGDTVRRYETVRTATSVHTSPDGTRLLVERNPMQFDLVEAMTGNVLWSLTRTEPISMYWCDDHFMSCWLTSATDGSLIDASTGQEVPGKYSGLPVQVVRTGGRTLAIDLYGGGLKVLNVESHETLLEIPFRLSGAQYPDRKQLRFSEDGSSVLLDHVDETGRVATARWKLGDKQSSKSFVFSPFQVAANGTVLQCRSSDAPVWMQKLEETMQDLMGHPRSERFYSTVFDPSGNCLLQITHTDTSPNYREEASALTDGGQGLVVLNNQGLDYYRIPPGWTFRPVYWLVLLAPVLISWGVSQRRKPPATSPSTPSEYSVPALSVDQTRQEGNDSP